MRRRREDETGAGFFVRRGTRRSVAHPPYSSNAQSHKLRTVSVGAGAATGTGREAATSRTRRVATKAASKARVMRSDVGCVLTKISLNWKFVVVRSHRATSRDSSAARRVTPSHAAAGPAKRACRDDGIQEEWQEEDAQADEGQGPRREGVRGRSADFAGSTRRRGCRDKSRAERRGSAHQARPEGVHDVLHALQKERGVVQVRGDIRRHARAGRGGEHDRGERDGERVREMGQVGTSAGTLRLHASRRPRENDDHV